jgi:hypothetical protein
MLLQQLESEWSAFEDIVLQADLLLREQQQEYSVLPIDFGGDESSEPGAFVQNLLLSDALTIHRIDSGWTFPTTDKDFLPLLFTETPPDTSLLHEIRLNLLNDDVRYLIDTKMGSKLVKEYQLYDMLEDWLYTGGGWFGFGGMWGRKKVSRQRFHLFLRWCTERGSLFSLRGDAYVWRLDGWKKI